MLNIFLKPAKSVAFKLSLLLVFTAIYFFSYQITKAETPSTLSTPAASLCSTQLSLSLGMIGTEVLELQRYLNNNGYSVATSGFGAPGQETTYFGELTKNALVKLQATHNLQVTFGVFDSITKKFLGCATPDLTFNRDLKLGMVGTDVLKLQQFLNNNGFPVAIIGPGSKGQETTFFGELTKNALSQFQKANQIPTESGSPLGTTLNLNSTYILTYKAGAGGTITGSTSQSIKPGSNGTAVTANPQRGFYFTKWSDGLTTNPRTDIKVQANQAVTATFARRLTAEGGGRTPSTPALVPVTAIGDITGTLEVGSLLTAGAPTPAEATLSYQWQSATTSGGVYANISGATESTYTLVSADLGKFIKVVATGTVTYNGAVTSTATAVVLGDVSFTYSGSPVTYGTVYNPTTGRVWLDRNLGAAQVALSSTDADAYGDLFQWGRPPDGHQIRTSDTQAGQVATITPGTDTFIIDLSGEWSSIDSDGALRSAYLAKTDGTGICPAGFRLPTDTELDAERLSWSSNNSAGAFASPLKVTRAGGRIYDDGFLNSMAGLYWSSTIDGTSSRYLDFNIGSAGVYSGEHAYGFSVRCLKD